MSYLGVEIGWSEQEEISEIYQDIDNTKLDKKKIGNVKHQSKKMACRHVLNIFYIFKKSYAYTFINHLIKENKSAHTV